LAVRVSCFFRYNLLSILALACIGWICLPDGLDKSNCVHQQSSLPHCSVSGSRTRPHHLSVLRITVCPYRVLAIRPTGLNTDNHAPCWATFLCPRLLQCHPWLIRCILLFRLTYMICHHHLWEIPATKISLIICAVLKLVIHSKLAVRTTRNIPVNNRKLNRTISHNEKKWVAPYKLLIGLDAGQRLYTLNALLLIDLSTIRHQDFTIANTSNQPTHQFKGHINYSPQATAFQIPPNQGISYKPQ
jgi:hypothetical protein